MKTCVVCSSQEVYDPKSDYCKSCEETLKEIYEQELEKERERTFKENAEVEAGTNIRTYEEIFELIKERITELVYNVKFGLEGNLSIKDINLYKFRDKLHDKLLKATFKNYKLLLRYKSSGICDSPGHTVDYDIEFLINQKSEFYYQLTYTNGECELCDSSYIPVTQDYLDTDDDEDFIDNIINKLEEL